MKKIKLIYLTSDIDVSMVHDDVTDALIYDRYDFNDIFKTAILPKRLKSEMNEINYFNVEEINSASEYYSVLANSMNVSDLFIDGCSDAFELNLFLDVKMMIQAGLIEYFKIQTGYSYDSEYPYVFIPYPFNGVEKTVAMKLVGIDEEISFSVTRFQNIIRKIIEERTSKEVYEMLEYRAEGSFGIEIFANPLVSMSKYHDTEFYGLIGNLASGTYRSRDDGLAEIPTDIIESLVEILNDFDYSLLKEEIINDIHVTDGVDKNDLRNSLIFLEQECFDSLMNRGPNIEMYDPEILGDACGFAGNEYPDSLQDATTSLEIDPYYMYIREATLPKPMRKWLEDIQNIDIYNMSSNRRYIGGVPRTYEDGFMYFLIEDFRIRSK